MKNAKDLVKVGKALQKRYGNISFEVKEKPYPESIIPYAKIVDSMRLFVKYGNVLYTSGRLDSNCDDRVFDLHIEDLKEQLERDILGIVRKEFRDLPF